MSWIIWTVAAAAMISLMVWFMFTYNEKER